MRTQGKLDTIWNWENRANVPSQKIELIDVDGEIKIDFDILSLISNKSFEGKVSLEAEIPGINGTRKIEANPYSEVGIKREPIGIKSEAPSEISKKLLNMLRELSEAADIYEDLKFSKLLAAEQRDLLFGIIDGITFLCDKPGMTVTELEPK